MRNYVLGFFLLGLFLFCNNGFSQVAQKMIYENVVRGSIIMGGKEIEGYMKRMGTAYLPEFWYQAPWEFQKGIRFIEKGVFEKAQKIRNKDYIKFEAGDIDGYKYHGDSLIFESVKYADMSALGMNMIPKKMFMRRVLEGSICLYHHFHLPPSFGQVSELRKIYTEYANPEVVYRINRDGKLKLVNGLNVKKEFVGCPVVVEKYEKGEYGLQGGDPNASGLVKLADKTLFRDEVRLLAITDYNLICR